MKDRKAIAPASHRLIRASQVADTATIVVVPGIPGAPVISDAATGLAYGVARGANDPFGDLKLHAINLVEEAEAEAAHIVARAEAEAITIRQQAKADGIKAGEEAGHRQVLAESTTLLRTLQATVEELNAYRTSLSEDHAQDALALAMCMAQRILRQTITVDPSYLERMLTDLLRPLRPLEGLTIRVHPDEAALLEACRPGLQDQGMADMQILTDRTLPPGAIRCTFEGGEVDASLNGQLLRLQTAISTQLLRDSHAAE